MITWLDALLVTLWAALTALGARRGLSGLLWGVGGVAACLLANAVANAVAGAGVLALGGALLLGAGLAALTGRLIRAPLEYPWHTLVGALGGALLGGVLVATLVLGFPLDVKVSPGGLRAEYPSTNLSPTLYRAVKDSALNTALTRVWTAHPALRTLIVPDRVAAR